MLRYVWDNSVTGQEVYCTQKKHITCKLTDMNFSVSHHVDQWKENWSFQNHGMATELSYVGQMLAAKIVCGLDITTGKE